MLRSLFAGISGLRANQTMLDVVGNNIANANTAGFKASTVLFQDTLSQMLIGAAGANAYRGGTNPIQVGLGVQVAATHTNFQQGSSQFTGRATDLMIQGDGFFVVQRGRRDPLHPRGRLHLRRGRRPDHDQGRQPGAGLRPRRRRRPDRRPRRHLARHPQRGPGRAAPASR